MIAPADVAWQEDVEVAYADPDEVLDPCGLSVHYPLYSVDSELSTESSNRQWSCRLLPCIPPLGLVSASLGLQLASGFLLWLAATNGQRLHGLTPSLIDAELPFIHPQYTERNPKTYAWCLAYVLSAVLVFFSLAAAVAATIAVCLACCKWARVLRALGIIQAFLCMATAIACGMWLAGYAVAQSGYTTEVVKNFLRTFNYGTLLFAKTHEGILRAAGTMAAAGAAASARTARATCHETAVGATTTSFALVLTWAVSFLLMQSALGAMAPPVFGVPATLVAFACLLQLNFGCCEKRRYLLMMMLFFAAMFIALVAWSAAQETYTINYTNRPHKKTPLVVQLKKLINLKQWGIALGKKLGVASFVALAAAQSILCLFAGTVMFYRAFGHKIAACKRKRRQKKRDRSICAASNHTPCGGAALPAAVVTTYTTPVVLSPQPMPAPRKILVPPPPHAVLP